MFKGILRQIVPKKVKSVVLKVNFFRKLSVNYFYDLKRYLNYSATLEPYISRDRYHGRITAHYHVLEKGLSLEKPRVGFGIGIVYSLLEILERYKNLYGLDETSQIALNVLFSYYQFNLEHGKEDHELFNRLIALKNALPDAHVAVNQGGTRLLSKAEIYQAAKINFKAFVSARHSIRNFAKDSVPLDVIKEAVSMAIQTPSVCNRQTWRVHLYSDEELKKKVLSFQNGNRGFGNSANYVMVITSDINYFLGESERNQCFIDGGMFAMSIVYALHSLGVGTCCLNWSTTAVQDRAFRSAVPIPESQVIIMMIAVGYLPDQLTVAYSFRKDVSDILVTH